LVASRRVVLIAALVLAASSHTLGQTPEPFPTPNAEAAAAPDLTLSGRLYGDCYHVIRSHRDELECQNGFWIR
jgi:hypothetical protein